MQRLGTRRDLIAASLAVAIVGALAGCRAQPPLPGPSGTVPSGPPASLPVGPTLEPGSRTGLEVGIEYGLPGLADDYAPLGLGRAKPALEFGVWGNIEPVRGQRDWRPLDTLVAEYQAAGFTDLQLLISADSPWAARTPKRDPMPKDAYLLDYVDFVRSFVERYDGDGVDDAAGLLAPVHEFGIEREFTGFWGSSAADYVRLLGLATPAIRTADPAAEVILVAILAIDVFDGGPAPDVAEARWTVDAPFRKSRADVVTILGQCPLFDAVDVHSLGDAIEIPPTLDWVRARLAEAGCPDRPIWVGDAFAASALVAYNARPFYPATAGDRDAIVAALGAAVDPADPAHAASLAWVRAEIARGLVRKVALATLGGARGINIGNEEDWTTGIVPADRLLVAGIGTAAVSGLLDTRRTIRQPGGGLPYEGNGFAFARDGGAPRPGFAALALAAAAVSDATSVSRVDVGDPTAWVIRFERPSGPAWLACLDDGSLPLPGDPGPSRDVTFAVDAARIAVTVVPTDEIAALAEERATTDGRLTISIDRTPRLVEPR